MSSPSFAQSIVRDAKEHLKEKMAARKPLLTSRVSRGHFVLEVFFRVTRDGLSERGTTGSLVPGLIKDYRMLSEICLPLSVKNATTLFATE